MITEGGFEFVRRDGAAVGVACTEMLGAGAIHLFTTRNGGVSAGCYGSLNMTVSTGDDPACVAENLRRAREMAGNGRICRTRQVHGDRILAVDEANADVFSGDDGPECDGLMTDTPGLTLLGKTADCVPVLIYDPVRSAAAFVHAGWRGTALKIADTVAARLAEAYGSRPSDCIAAVGPAIGPCCFLTHTDVTDAMRQSMGGDADAWIRPAEDGRYHVDLKRLNADQLDRAGVGRVYVCPHCTACMADTYYSHRRNGLMRGSMATLITLTKGTRK